MASPTRPSALAQFESPSGARQSPFRRQNSVSPATTVRASTPNSSPIKSASNLSPTKVAQLSPEKTSPFVRRPSQLGHNATDRPSSPFARPTSSLSIPTSPSREPREASPERRANEQITPLSSPTRQIAASTVVSNSGADTPPSFKPPSQANLRPTAHRTTTDSSTATVKASIFAPNVNKPTAGGGTGSYAHLPQPLLHSMRESFEVLDTENSSAISSASVASMLDQLGLDATPASLLAFFPPSQPSNLSLARYLDVLSGPLAELSSPEELRAAFEAFDIDDSGQIDVATLHNALMRTPVEDVLGGEKLTEKEIEGILGEFSGRRAFGAKGLNAAKGKGDVFRYRDFMANVSAGGAAPPGSEAAVAI